MKICTVNILFITSTPYNVLVLCWLVPIKLINILKNMFQIIFVLFCLTTMCFCSLEVIQQADSDKSRQCLKKIMENYANPKTVIVTNMDLVDLGWTYQTMQCNDADFVYFDIKKADFYVIELDNNASTTIDTLAKQYSFNPRAKAIFLTNDVNVDLFKQIDYYYLINAVVLNKLTYKVYINFPYVNEDSNNPSENYVELGDCLEDLDLFPNKIPKQWRNTTVKLNYILVPPFVTCPPCDEKRGYEVELYRFLQSVLKFEVQLTTRYKLWGRKNLTTNQYSDAYGAIQNRTDTSGVGGFRTTTYENYDFDVTPPIKVEHMTWLIPIKYNEDHWKTVADVFEVHTWMLLFCLFLAVALAFYVVLRDDCPRRTLAHCLFYSYEIVIGNATKGVNGTLHKIVHIGWRYMVLIVVNIFSTKLLSLLTREINTLKLDSLQDLIDADLKFGLFTDILKLYDASRDPIEKYIVDHNEYCAIDNSCFERIAYKKDMATARGSWLSDYSIVGYMDEEGRPLIYKSNKVFPVTFLMNWYFRRGYPMYEQINQLVQAMIENGVLGHIRSLVDDDVQVKRTNSLKKMNSVRSRPLTLTHLNGFFYLWLAGCGVGTLVFFVELFCCRNKCSKVVPAS